MAQQTIGIRRDQVTLIDGVLLAEASDLALRAWPRVIGIPARDGGEILFRYTGSVRDADDLLYTEYRQYTGTGSLVLRIFND